MPFRSYAYLPVLGVARQHHRVLGLADLASIVLLDLLDVLGRLDALILGKGTLVAPPAGVGQEVRANRLDVPAGGGREMADSLEVLVSRPARRQGRQCGESRCHCGDVVDV